MTTADQEQIIWLAGLLEGEGCFGISRSKTCSLMISITVKMVDLDVVDKAAAIMGKGARGYQLGAKEGWQTQYYAKVCGYRAAEMMTLLLPYMGERRSKKIKECLEAWNTRHMIRKPRGPRPPHWASNCRNRKAPLDVLATADVTS